jgi:hypothetical protein
MKPINFKESTHVYTPPEGMDGCGDLHVHDTGEALISKWQLSAVELAEINRTGCVYLWVWGRGQPPVVIEARDPFVEVAP